MTDPVVIGLGLGVIATIQAVTTAWISYQVNKNACGGTKCQKYIKDQAKNVRVE